MAEGRKIEAAPPLRMFLAASLGMSVDTWTPDKLCHNYSTSSQMVKTPYVEHVSWMDGHWPVSLLVSYYTRERF